MNSILDHSICGKGIRGSGLGGSGYLPFFKGCIKADSITKMSNSTNLESVHVEILENFI